MPIKGRRGLFAEARIKNLGEQPGMYGTDVRKWLHLRAEVAMNYQKSLFKAPEEQRS